jgi:hypothetical protein
MGEAESHSWQRPHCDAGSLGSNLRNYIYKLNSTIFKVDGRRAKIARKNISQISDMSTHVEVLTLAKPLKHPCPCLPLTH